MRYNCSRAPAPTSPATATTDVVDVADADGELPGEIISGTLASSPAPAVPCEREGTITVEDDAAVDAAARVPKARKADVDASPRSHSAARAAIEVGPDVSGGRCWPSRGSPALQPTEDSALSCAEGKTAAPTTAAAPPGLPSRTVNGKRIRTKNDLLQLTEEELALWHARRAQLRGVAGPGREETGAEEGTKDKRVGKEGMVVVDEDEDEEEEEEEVRCLFGWG